MAFNTGKKISSLISRMLPSFIAEDHSTLANFLIDFLEYIEQTGQPYDLVANSDQYSDIDTTLDSWLDEFKSQYIADVPDQIAANARHVIKQIRTFYISKGNEVSYEMIFSLIYGTYVKFYYPKVDILRASDGKWNVPYYIHTVETAQTGLLDKFITGGTSGAKGYVNDILSIEDPSNIGQYFNVLSISNKVGDFQLSEIITDTADAGNTLTISGTDGVIVGDGRYDGTDGQLSSNKYLQDNHYYQDYSYELITDISIDAYGDTIRQLVHPAGMEMFGVVESDNVTAIGNISDSTTWTIQWFTDTTSFDSPFAAYPISNIEFAYNVTAYAKYNEYDYDYVNQELIKGVANNGDHYLVNEVNYDELSQLTIGEFIINSANNTTLVSVNGTKLLSYGIVNDIVTLPQTYVADDTLSVYSLGPSTVLPWRFDGDNATTTFALGGTYNINDLLVYVDGIKMKFTSEAYISTTNIVFVTPPAIGTANIEVFLYRKRFAPEKLSGDSSTTSFVLSNIPRRESVNAIIIYVDGKQRKVVINNSTNTIIFGDAFVPTSGTDNIEIIYLQDIARINDYVNMDGVSLSYSISDITHKFRIRGGSDITIH